MEEKAVKWWRSLSINEMKGYEKQYKNIVHIISEKASIRDIIKIYDIECNNNTLKE